MTLLDTKHIREDFPILSRNVRGKSLVYLDSGATSQKPASVIQAMTDYYSSYNANVHRGVYWLSQEASEKYEAVRGKVGHFIGVTDEREIIFTSGTTESINLVASTWGRTNIQAGDDVIVTRLEHHSNFVPWQALAKERGANFKIVELTSDYRIDLDSLKNNLAGKPKILAISLMSNALGTITPIREIATLAKNAGAVVVVDAAQAAAHLPLDIKQLGPIDFLAFSSHKLCGPTGFGILWGRHELLDKMPPYQYGGDMILRVEDHETRWNELPLKFEAGTPNIAGAIGFGAALDYLTEIGMEKIQAHEIEIGQYALKKLQTVKDLKIIGPVTNENRGSLFSFVLGDVHPHDIATFLDSEGIAVRAGHHCVQHLNQKLGITATTRASFSFYNNLGELDHLVEALNKTRTFFGKERH